MNLIEQVIDVPRKTIKTLTVLVIRHVMSFLGILRACANIVFSILGCGIYKSLLLLLVHGCLSAQTPLKEIRFVGDIHNVIPNGVGDIYSSDEGIIAFDVVNNQAIVRSNDLGSLPHTQIDGYHASDDGCDTEIYSVDTSTEIANVVMHGADVFKFNGVKVLDASAESIPYGVNVDAISRHPDNCDLIFSIDTIAEIDGNVYYPDDLIRFSNTIGVELLHRFNFSKNIDAIHMLNATTVLLSLDITAEINGTTVFDDDVFEFDILDNTAKINFSPETLNSSWQSADVNAIWAKPVQAGSIQWQINSISVNENIGTFNLIVDRISGNDGEVIVSFSSSDGQALGNVDYISVNSSLTLFDGQNSAVQQVTILDDTILEGAEDFTISITSVTGGAQIGTISEIEIIITDNDAILIFKDDFEN